MRVVARKPNYAPTLLEFDDDKESIVTFTARTIGARNIAFCQFNEHKIMVLFDEYADNYMPVNFMNPMDGEVLHGTVIFYREINGSPVEMTDEHLAMIFRFFDGHFEDDGLQRMSEEADDEFPPDL